MPRGFRRLNWHRLCLESCRHTFETLSRSQLSYFTSSKSSILNLPNDFFKYTKSVAKSPSFLNVREVTLRLHLPAGRYVVVPSTFRPNFEATFLLRIFTEYDPKQVKASAIVGRPKNGGKKAGKMNAAQTMFPYKD